METASGGVSDHTPQPQDLMKLIRKLRWIGMEKEAHRLEAAAASLPPEERGAVAAEPTSTD